MIVFSIIIIVEQLIESYVLEPLIIGHEVRINPLSVIIAIVLGGMVWGLAGMVTFCSDLCHDKNNLESHAGL